MSWIVQCRQTYIEWSIIGAIYKFWIDFKFNRERSFNWFQVDVWKKAKQTRVVSTSTRAQHGTSTSCAASTCFTIFSRLVEGRERARRQLISLFFNKHYLPSQPSSWGGEHNIKPPTLLRQLFDEDWRLLHDTIIIIVGRNMRWEFIVDERSVGRSFQLMLGSAVVERRNKICHKTARHGKIS